MPEPKLYTAGEILRRFPTLHASDIVRFKGKQRYYGLKAHPEITFTRRQAEYLPGGNLYGLNITYDAFKSLDLPRPSKHGKVQRTMKKGRKRIRVDTGWKQEIYHSESDLYEALSFIPRDRLVRVVIFGKEVPPRTDPFAPEDEPDYHDVLSMRTSLTALESVEGLSEYLAVKYYDIEQFIVLTRPEFQSETRSRVRRESYD